MPSGDFSMVVQSWDQLVPSAKMNVGETPFSDYDFARPDLGQVMRREAWGKSSERTYYPTQQILQLWWVFLCKQMAKEELGISISEEMEGNCHKEKEDGGTQTRIWVCYAFAEDWLLVICKCQMELMDISELICHWIVCVVCEMWASVNEKKLSYMQKEVGWHDS